jgi:hypothetical protein
VLTDALFYGSLSSRVDNNGVFISELAEKDALKIISELEKFDIIKNVEEDSEGFKEWLESADPKSFVSNSYEEDDLKLAWDACLAHAESKLGVDPEAYESIFEYVDHLKDMNYELEQNYLVEKDKNQKLLQELEKFNKADETKYFKIINDLELENKNLRATLTYAKGEYFKIINELEIENRNLRATLTYAKGVLDSNLPISPNKDTHEKINSALGK